MGVAAHAGPEATMRYVLPLACLALVSACGSREEPAVLKSAGRPVAEVPSSKVLAGRSVHEAREGGWAVRKAKSPESRDEVGAPRGVLRAAEGIDKGDIDDAAVARKAEVLREAAGETKGAAGGKPMSGARRGGDKAMPLPAPSGPPPTTPAATPTPAGIVPPGVPAGGSGPVLPTQPVQSGLKAGATDD